MDEDKSNRKIATEKPKRFSVRALILSVAAAVLVTIGALFGVAWLTVGPEGLSLLEAMALINIRFVGEYEKSDVMDAAAQGMITALNDRWSFYLDAEGYAAQKLNRDNSYVGVGITVSYEDERGLLVLSVIEGGPGDEAGILPGDIICAVDSVSIADEARYQSAELIRGELGTVVTLELIGTDGETRTADVKRNRVEEDPVSYRLLDGNVGVITLKNFFSRSAAGVEAAAEDLIAQGAVALVFDLRNNPGGYLDELTEMLDYLLPEGPIFRSHGRTGDETVITSDADCVELPMAVLVNGNSYSAAEFFAAQLRETVGAVVVGTQTTGKGHSQQIFPLLTGGALSFSTRAYLTGKGVSLIDIGLTPEPYVELTDEEFALLLRGELEPSDDPQLKAAIKELF